MVDQQNNLLSRDVATYHIIFTQSSKPSRNQTFQHHYEVQAIVAHKGKAPNYLYLTHWVGYGDPEYFTYEPAEHFDSKTHVELYWARRTTTDEANNEKILGSTSASLPTTIHSIIRKRADITRHSDRHSRIIPKSQRLFFFKQVIMS